MKHIFLSSLLLSSPGFAQNQLQDMQSVISVQQSVISQLKQEMQSIQAELTTMKALSYSKSEADARFMNVSQAGNSYSKSEADARFMNVSQAGNSYSKSEANSLFMLLTQASKFIPATERSSLQKKVSAYMASCSWNDSTHYYTCACGPGEVAVSAGAAAWGGDSIKELYPVNTNSWQATCIDHDKEGLDSLNKCMRWSQVMCLKI